MRNKVSLATLCEKIWTIEDNFRLLDFEVSGVKVWQFLRMHIYYEIAKKTGVLESPNISQRNISNLCRNVGIIIWSSLFKNPFYCNKSKDILIFSHNRSKTIDGEKIDIYTNYLIEELEKSGKSYLELEKPYNCRHDRAFDKKKAYLDFINVLGGLSWLFGGKIAKEQAEKILKINDHINDSFDIKINLLRLFRNGIGRFKAVSFLYKKLFQKLQPQKIFVVVGYAYMGDMIYAAKKLNIETIELQHGVISRYHLGYSFPGRYEQLDLLPDRFLRWGPWWGKFDGFPWEESRVADYGFPYFNHLRSRYVGNKKDRQKIIVLSQGALGEKIAGAVLDLMPYLSSYEIIYKLHPEEYEKSKHYQSLEKIKEFNNVLVVKNCDLYDYFSKCFYQIGVFSTAIFEGIGFKCKTILLDLPGVEYMERLNGLNSVRFLKDYPSCINNLLNELSVIEEDDENDSNIMFFTKGSYG